MKNVMLVDDSRIMRNFIKRTFERIGKEANFLEAADGEKALEVLLGNHVDLILLDWNMPNLSGIDFLKQVRAMENYKNVPIVMVTSEAAKLNVIEALHEGATAYMTKPFNDKLFMEKLSALSF